MKNNLSEFFHFNEIYRNRKLKMSVCLLFTVRELSIISIYIHHFAFIIIYISWHVKDYYLFLLVVVVVVN
jgi:hypothetical protein